MNAKSIGVLAGSLVSVMLAGCLIVPGYQGRGVVLVPALPVVVELGPEPYYVQDGYYYYYQNNAWYYAHSRGGPWVVLPRDRYPKEVKFKDRDAGRDEGHNPGHQGK